VVTNQFSLLNVTYESAMYIIIPVLMYGKKE